MLLFILIVGKLWGEEKTKKDLFAVDYETKGRSQERTSRNPYLVVFILEESAATDFHHRVRVIGSGIDSARY